MSKSVAVLCSRRYSSRLPEKAFLRIGGKTLLELCLDRLLKIGIPVVLAVPSEELFSDYIGFQREGLEVMAGDSSSPLKRTAQALRAYPDAKYVLRATHDDPLIDPAEAKNLLENAIESRAGYGITRGIVEGGGLEVIDRENLDWAATRYSDRIGEFISYYVKAPGCPNPKREDVPARNEVIRPYRLTLDYPEDFLVLKSVLQATGTDASLDEVCRFLDRNPELNQVNQLPVVSFYTCAWNAEKYLGETIRSVLGATRLPCEYVILDDGSTDGTLLEAVRWSGRLGNPPWLKIVTGEHNLGLASRSNEAIGHCRGKYVMRVDADDMLLPGAVDEMVEMAEAERADAVYAGFQRVREDGYTYHGLPSENQDRHAGCALMRRSFIAEARFREGLRLGDSKALWDERMVEAKVITIPEVKWFYRKHADSLTARAGFAPSGA